MENRKKLKRQPTTNNIELGLTDWAWLSSHLLDSILLKLIPDSDYIRFGAVCKHWQSVALDLKQHRHESRHRQLPLLMFRTSDDDKTSFITDFYRVAQGTRKNIGTCRFPFSNVICSPGSSQGWWACTDENWVLTLLNPFTGRTIKLPSLATQLRPRPRPGPFSFVAKPVKVKGGYFFVATVVLSADPCLFPNDYQVVVIYHHIVAHLSSGDETWTLVNDDKDSKFHCAIYHRGQFILANGNGGGVFAVGAKPKPREICMLVPGVSEKMVSDYTLVESSGGDLILIARNRFCLLEINVYKLSTSGVFGQGNIRPRWAETQSIGSDSLFLDGSHSMCASTLDFPGCRPNSMYVICWDKGLAVVDLESKKIVHSSNILPEGIVPQIWILPIVV